MNKGFSLVTRVRNAIRYLGRGDIKGLIQRLKFYRRERMLSEVHSSLSAVDGALWGIITTPHTIFVAKTIQERLSARGIDSEILMNTPKGVPHNIYIVLCAQMFDILPPPERRIIFQLEQSVSSRWFTKAYLNALKNSLAVLEYSLDNIQYLADKDIKYPHVTYLPIGTSIKPPETVALDEKKYDFIFYGDSLSSKRRRKMLKALEENFRVKICNDLFGDEMAQLIRQAHAVVNIHYYENALLEMPRIQECISLGVPILSESSADQNDYPELGGAVAFFQEGSIDSMLKAAANMINHIADYSDEVMKSASSSSHRFTFMFDRFLVSLGVLPATAIFDAPIYLEKNSDFIGLSLPETINRRKVFIENKPADCAVFDGVRNIKGWIGCGSSFSALARYALAQNLDHITIIEDDALLPEDFHEKINIVKKYLKSNQCDWDIFSGMMASVHESAEVSNVEVYEGLTFVTINRMTSTVCNIYSKNALSILSEWDPMDLNVDRNTIDRYIENNNEIRIVVVLPFIAGHREELESTLWGFNNVRYAPMIAQSELRIQHLAEQWKLNVKSQ